MAIPAEEVVVELYARGLDRFERDMAQASSTTQRSLSQVEQSATRAEGVVRSASSGIARGMDQASMRTRLLGYQISDVGTQLAGGQSPFLILAQQAPQVANALEGTTGVAGRMATFFSGPWGAALLAAGSVLGVLIGKLVGMKSELEEATGKLLENAHKAEVDRAAHEQFAATLAGVTEAIRANKEMLGQLDHAHDTAAQSVLRAALLGRARVTQLEAETRALIQQARAQVELNDARNRVAGNDPRITGPLNAENDALRNRLTQLEAELAAVPGQMAEARRQIDAATSRRVVELASRSPEEVIHDRYSGPNGLIEQARKRALAEHQTTIELGRQVAALRAQEQAEIASLQRAERQARRTPTTPRTLTRPVTGGLLAPYGADRSGVPLHGRLIPGRRHEGLDFRGNIGDPVVAPEGGRALVRNDPGGLGLNVVITADSGARNILAHLSGANVRSGDRVTAGQLIGLVGNSGNAAGGVPHLHYQRIVNGHSVDPTRMFGASGAAQAADAAQTAAERAVREQAQLAERRQRDEEQFQQQLTGLNADILNARRRGVQTEEEAAAADRAGIVAEQAERDQRIRSQAADRIRRDATQTAVANAEAGILLAKSAELAQVRTAASDAAHQQRLDEQRIDIAIRDLNDQESVLQARGQLARTAMERRDIELRLLALQHQEELQAIEKQRISKQIDDAEAARRRASADTRYDLAKQSTLRSTAGPLEAFFNAVPRGAEQMNQALQEVAVHGLQSLNDGLATAATRFLHLGGVAGQVLNTILSDLIHIALQQAELAAFGGGGGKGGGGGIFAAILGGATKGFADTDPIFAGKPGGGNWWDLATKIPGHATGYVGPIGGLGGIDRNVLSINGRPRARVSGSETLAIIPQGSALGYAGGRAAGGGGSGAPQFNIHIDARDAVLTHQVRAWVREGVEEASLRGAGGGATYMVKRSAQRARQTL